MFNGETKIVMVIDSIRNQVKGYKSYSEADIESDHNLVTMNSHLKLKNPKKRDNIRKM